MKKLTFQAIKTKIFPERGNLIRFITSNIKHLKNNSILVITSKIVALSEGRVGVLQDKEKLIISESEWAIKTKYVWLTKKDGQIMASAGIDESNAKNKLILLPKNSYTSANKIRTELLKHYKIKNLGIIITDSRTIPFRAGITGMALGYAGFKGVKDYTKLKDIYGRGFKFSKVNIVDSLSAGAVLTMGEGNEQKPLAIIENSNVIFTNKINKRETQIKLEDDIYFPLFKSLK